jgi:hypothetical protein
LVARAAERHRAVTDAAAFDEAYDGAGIQRQDWGTALAQGHGMTQQKDLGGGSRLLQLRLFQRKHCARRAVFDRCLKAPRILQASRVKRNREHRLARDSGV